MKTIAKVSLGLALFLFLSGVLLAVAGRAMGANTSLVTVLNGYPVKLHLIGINGIGSWGDWDDYDDYEGHSSTNTVSISSKNSTGERSMETLSEVNIEVNAAEVEFRQAEDYGVELTWSRDDLAMDYSIDNGVLTIWSKQDRIRDLKNHKATVTVYMPQDAVLDQLEISVDMGSANLNGLTVDYLDIGTDMGAVKLTDISARSAELTSDMGDVTAKGLTVTDSLVADCSMGDIDLSGDISGNVDLECDMGAMTLRTSTPASEFGYDLVVDMGSIHVDGKTFRNEANRSGGSSYLEAECSMGDIEIQFGA